METEFEYREKQLLRKLQKFSKKFLERIGLSLKTSIPILDLKILNAFNGILKDIQTLRRLKLKIKSYHLRFRL